MYVKQTAKEGKLALGRNKYTKAFTLAGLEKKGRNRRTEVFPETETIME